MRGRPPGKLKGAAQAHYTPAPSEAEIRAGGWEPEDFAEDDFQVWPENWPAWSLFETLSTQWRTVAAGMTGLLVPTGLDYLALYPLLDRAAAGDAAEWEHLLSDVRVLEAQALRTMAQHRRTNP